jgi:hypothetical protein
MKKLIVLILLAAAFFGGYHVGRLPGAPDLTAAAQKICGQIRAASKNLPAVVRPDKPTVSAAANHAQEILIKVDGKVYSLAQRSTSSEANK